MKEKEFMKKYPKERIEVSIYFGIDDKGDVIIDEEGITDEFNIQLDDILEQTRLDKDELQELVVEKINKDKKKNEQIKKD